MRGVQNLRAGNNCSRRLNSQTARPDQGGLRCLKTKVLPATQFASVTYLNLLQFNI